MSVPPGQPAFEPDFRPRPARAAHGMADAGAASPAMPQASPTTYMSANSVPAYPNDQSPPGAATQQPAQTHLTQQPAPGYPPQSTAAFVPAIQAHNLVKTYGTGDAQIRPLNGLSVEIGDGEFTAIMGPSGSGKSTLMHILAGLDSPDSGQVLLGRKELTRMSEKQLTKARRDHIGFIFQAFNLVPAMTAQENILLPSRLAKSKVDRDFMNRIVGLLGLADRLDHRPHELSGGQQQRVAVARALVTRPDVLFADEPTGNLDSVTGHEVLGLLRAAVDEFGQTVVMVTHDAAAAATADRVILLADGRLVGDLLRPTPEQLNAAMAEAIR